MTKETPQSRAERYGSQRSPKRELARVAMCAFVAGSVLFVAGCGGRSNDARVFEEAELGATAFDGRAYALRLTVFEFAEDAGGFVEWFALDGDVNTNDSPYFVASHCAYFGQGPLDDGEFRVDSDGPDGERLLLQVTRQGRAELQARVVSPGGAFDAPPALPLSFVDSDRDPTRQCR